MDLSNLKPAKGSTKKRKRIGRGQGSGYGGTSTKGHKGQRSRSGASIPAWFEGGQMPLSRRIPKYGFTNPNRVAYKAVNVARLAGLAAEGKINASEPVTPAVLVALGLVQEKDRVKVLGNGDIDVSLKIEAHGFSASAKEKIEKAGGEISIIN